ncbi:MAG: sugar kinase, partial [Mycobacteriaceae bacterium]|nr:sugar kinase [Mycobacteriaceae bacterium]
MDVKHTSPPKGRALFVGLATCDIAYLVDEYLSEDSKTQALDQFLGAGGPAANAAITFAFLSGESPALLTALGQHFLTEVVRADLHRHRVQVLDATPTSAQAPPLSSIVVARRSQTRTIVSLDSSRIRAPFEPAHAKALHEVEIVLIDGHLTDMCQGIAEEAHRQGIPVVLDAGRWRPSHAALLPVVDVAICSAVFRPPGVEPGDGPDAVLDHLLAAGVRFAAISRGPEAIVYAGAGRRGGLDVPTTTAVDTLGAGDILHGAFCHFYRRHNSFDIALAKAASVAAESCRYFGPREWMAR